MARASASSADGHTGRRVKHSRNGCVSCKERRLRCSEERPSCKRCIDDSRQCEYLLRLTWQDDSRERGVKHGRGKNDEASFVDPIPSEDLVQGSGWNMPRSQRRHFLNTTKSDISGPQVQSLQPLNQLHRRNYVPQLHYSLRLYELSTSDGALFQYYQAEVCPSLTLVDDCSNAYRQIVMPLSVSHESVMKSLLAVGALYLSLNQPSPETYALALQHKQRTLASLRRDVGSLGQGPRNHILISMLMLCLFDITDNCQISWSSHISAAANLMSTGDSRLCEPSLVTFVSKFFATRDEMGRTACGKKAKLKFTETAWLNPQEVDKSLGCSSELLNIISSITDLAREKVENEIIEKLKLEQDATGIEAHLNGIVQILPASNSPLTPEILFLHQTSSLIHKAAKIYLHTALFAAIPSTPIIRALIPEQMNLLGNMSTLRSAHLWSIFVTALYALDDQERIFFLEQFEKLELVSTAMGSVQAAKNIVQTVWKRRDLDADSETGSGNRMSDWARFVRPMSEGLSLA